MKKVTVIVLLAACAAAAPISAQSPRASTNPAAHAASPHQPLDPARIRQALSDSRRKMFASAMDYLSAEQLQAFWSVYADFEKEKNAITSARLDLAQKYVDTFAGAGLQDADIAEIVKEMVALQHKNVDLRLKYFEIYRAKIDTRTAGHFALVDDYITTANRLDLLSQIPFPGDAADK
jgi:hypothetical protein